MPFARTATPTPAALAKRVRRLAADLHLSARCLRGQHLVEDGWLIWDPDTGYVHGYKLTAEAAFALLERRKAKGRAS